LTLESSTIVQKKARTESAASIAATDAESRRSSKSSIDEKKEENFESMSEFNSIDFPEFVDKQTLEEKITEVRLQVEGGTKALSIKVNPTLANHARSFIQSSWHYKCESVIDELFVKAPQSPEKGAISFVVCKQFDDFGGNDGYASQDVILNVSGVQRAPDIAFWSARPTAQQRKHPIAQNCPLPNVWVEIVYNHAGDKQAALKKIREIIIPYKKVY
jgi:hypothetical protein